MFKNKLRLVLISLSLSMMALGSSSCSKKDTPSGLDDGDFFPITYIAKSYRAPGDSVWNPVQGQFEVQFIPDSTKQAGSYTMSYQSYLEPNFCPYNQNCVCSGGISGTFQTGTQIPNKPSPIYNPNDTYSPDNGGSTLSTPVDPTKTSAIYTFFFDIIVTKKSETSGCKPESNRQVELIRFTSGEIIMTNDYREQLLVPVTTGK